MAEEIIPQQNVEPEKPKNNKKRSHMILWICLSFFLIALFCFCLWFFWFQFREFTDDAYVAGNRVLVKPQISTSVVAFYADDNDFVEEGQLLVQLDTTSFAIALEKQKQDLGVTSQNIAALLQTLQQQNAQVNVQEVEVRKAQEDYEHRKALIGAQAVSLEDLEHAERALEAAKATLDTQVYQKANTLATLGSGPYQEHPSILSQKAQVRKAFYDLYHCRVLAPATGYVAKRAAQVGDFATTANTLMSIIPLDQMWIEANYKETQLRHMRIDQPVEVRVDLYGFSHIFKGKVAGIMMGTGSAFSLIPPQNATGNWIKIVQRVPVRIYIDREELLKYPLRIGLSCETFTDTSQRDGDVLRPPNAPSPFLERTSIYLIDMEALEKEMDEIVAQAFESG